MITKLFTKDSTQRKPWWRKLPWLLTFFQGLPPLLSFTRLSSQGPKSHWTQTFRSSLKNSRGPYFYQGGQQISIHIIKTCAGKGGVHWLRTWPMELDSPSSNCGPRTVMLWVLQEADSESRVLECWRVIRECSWNQLLWKEKEISRTGLREKLSCRAISVKAWVNFSGFWNWDGPSALSWDELGVGVTFVFLC